MSFNYVMNALSSNLQEVKEDKKEKEYEEQDDHYEKEYNRGGGEAETRVEIKLNG